MTEAIITINGHTLTNAQATALRAAVTDFMMTLADPDALGDDEHGRAMVVAYRARANEILRLLFTGMVTGPASRESS